MALAFNTNTCWTHDISVMQLSSGHEKSKSQMLRSENNPSMNVILVNASIMIHGMNEQWTWMISVVFSSRSDKFISCTPIGFLLLFASPVELAHGTIRNIRISFSDLKGLSLRLIYVKRRGHLAWIVLRKCIECLCHCYNHPLSRIVSHMHSRGSSDLIRFSDNFIYSIF